MIFNDTIEVTVHTNETTVSNRSLRQITLGVLQGCQVLSFFAYLFVGYHLLASPQHLRKTLSLHVIFVLFALNFIQLSVDISLALQYLNTGIVRPSFAATCTTWMFIDSFTYYLGLLLMAWATIERYLLIFHSHVFNTKRGRFLFHYLPILGLCLYALVYYIFVDFFYPCVNSFDFSFAFCGLVCYMNLPSPTLFGIEAMAHQVVPTFFISLFSIALLVRSVLSRRRLQQSIEWRKYRKMIVQILSISIVYLVFSVPFSINPIAQLTNNPTPFPYDVYLNVFSYWAYGICIFLPFVIATSLPNFVQKLKQLIIMRMQQRVLPVSENIQMHAM